MSQKMGDCTVLLFSSRRFLKLFGNALMVGRRTLTLTFTSAPSRDIHSRPSGHGLGI